MKTFGEPMPKIKPFENHFAQYDAWFIKYRNVYKSEVKAVRCHLPEDGMGIEIGVGSGRFAQPLAIHYGIEPSARMRNLAVKRGVNVIEGVAEELPIEDHFYDFALMVTTICFLDDVSKAIGESRRIIKTGGKLIVGFIDKNSPVGKLYKEHQKENVFYRDALFYSVDEVVKFMKQAGFSDFYFTQTIFRMLDEIDENEKVKEGYGEGSFVAMSAKSRESLLQPKKMTPHAL